MFKNAGCSARDMVTGFTGRIIYKVEYLTGCDQYGIQPGVNDKGEIPEPRQFDEIRVDILDDEPIVPHRQDNTRKMYISDMPQMEEPQSSPFGLDLVRGGPSLSIQDTKSIK